MATTIAAAAVANAVVVVLKEAKAVAAAIAGFLLLLSSLSSFSYIHILLSKRLKAAVFSRAAGRVTGEATYYCSGWWPNRKTGLLLS